MVSASVSGDAQISGIHQLVAPVALYPDPLLGLVLAASTQPNDVQAIANNQNGGQGQNLSAAAQGLSHYPELAQWMAQNQDWSNQLGYEFADRPGRVMKAIQDLRHRAFDAGTLRSDDHMLVVQNDGYIQIVPRDASTVFIPRYDANGVFAGRNAGVSISYSSGLPAGDWLAFYPMWGKHAVYQGDWYAYSQGHGGWRGLASIRVGMFGHVSGVNNTREWKVASDAQIRQGNYRNAAANGNYARPTQFGGGSATFQGDQQGQNQNRDQYNQDQNAQGQNQYGSGQNNNNRNDNQNQYNSDQNQNANRDQSADQRTSTDQSQTNQNQNQNPAANDQSTRQPMDQPATGDQPQTNGQTPNATQNPNADQNQAGQTNSQYQNQNGANGSAANNPNQPMDQQNGSANATSGNGQNGTDQSANANGSQPNNPQAQDQNQNQNQNQNPNNSNNSNNQNQNQNPNQ